MAVRKAWLLAQVYWFVILAFVAVLLAGDKWGLAALIGAVVLHLDLHTAPDS